MGRLQSAGLVKIGPSTTIEGDVKTSFYYLKSPIVEVIQGIKAVIEEDIKVRRRKYNGDFSSFEKDILDAPFLVKEGRNLRLEKPDTHKIDSNIYQQVLCVNNIIYNFLACVETHGGFTVQSENPTINIFISPPVRKRKSDSLPLLSPNSAAKRGRIPGNLEASSIRKSKTLKHKIALLQVRTPLGTGTGCLIARRLFITTQRLIPSLAVAKISSVIFFETGSSSSHCLIQVDPDTCFITSLADTELDYTIIALRPHACLDGIEERAFDIFQSSVPSNGDFVSFACCKTAGMSTVSKSLTAQSATEAYVLLSTNNEIYYSSEASLTNASTIVVNKDGEPVAIHAQNKAQRDGYTAGRGVLFKAIANDLIKRQLRIQISENNATSFADGRQPPIKNSLLWKKSSYFESIETSLVSIRRHKELSQIKKNLRYEDSLSIFAISGLPGMGKTALMQRYVNENMLDYGYVYWIDAKNIKSVEAQMNKLADALDIEADLPSEVRCLWIGEKIASQQSRFLFVFDHVDTENVMNNFEPYIPPAGHVLIAGRVKPGFDHLKAFHLPLSGFTEDEGVEYLLLQKKNISQEFALTITRTLNGVPLALALFASSNKGLSAQADGWLEQMQYSSFANKELCELADFEQTIYQLWRSVLDEVLERFPKCQQLVNFICCFPNHNVPLYIINAWIKDNNIFTSLNELKSCISELVNVGFISTTSSPGILVMHPFLHRAHLDFLKLSNSAEIDKISYYIESFMKKLDSSLEVSQPRADKLEGAKGQIVAYVSACTGSPEISPSKKNALIKQYEALSKSQAHEELREAFLNSVIHQPRLKHQLSSYPNILTGWRYTYLQAFERLQAEIESLRAKDPNKLTITGGIRARLKVCTWNGKLIPKPYARCKPQLIEINLDPTIIKRLIITEDLNNCDRSSFILRREYPTALHPVVQINSLFFKERCSHPCMEFAISNLISRLFGRGYTPSVLAKLCIRNGNSKSATISIMISLAVEGFSIENYLNEEKINELGGIDRLQLSEALLTHALTMPSDAHAANLIYTHSNEIVSIDNESCLVPIRKQSDKEIGQAARLSRSLFNSILFRLGNVEIEPSVLSRFTAWNPGLLLSDWIEGLLVIEQGWLSIFSTSEIQDLGRLIKDPRDALSREVNCFIHLVIPKGSIARLHQQILLLQGLYESRKKIYIHDLILNIVTCWEDVSDVGAAAKAILRAHRPYLKKPFPQLYETIEMPSQSTSELWMNLLEKIPSYDELCRGKYSAASALKELDQCRCFGQLALVHLDPDTADLKGIQALSTSRQLIFLRLLQQIASIEQLILPNFHCLTQDKLMWFLKKHKGRLKKIVATGCARKACFSQLVFDELATVKSLVYLSISDNFLADQGASWLANVLKSMKYLEKLDLSSNRIGDDGCVAIFNCLDGTRVTHLSLRSNRIGPKGAQHLAKKLSQTQLDTVLLNSNRVGTVGAVLIVKGSSESQVKHLDLRSNRIVIADLYSQVGTILKKLASDLRIELKYNLVENPTQQFRGANHFLNALKDIAITWNDFNRILLTEWQIQKIADKLSKIGCEHLDLTSLKLTDAGVHSLTSILNKCNRFVSLSIVNTGINHENFCILSAGIEIQNNLKHLDLSNNMLTAIGAVAVSTMLFKLSQIQILRLSSNRIGIEQQEESIGAVKLAEVLPRTKIKVLDLSSNRLGDRGLLSLSKGIRGLEKLIVCNNNISDRGVCKLTNSIKGSCIKLIDLSDNLIGSTGANELISCILTSNIDVKLEGNRGISWNRRLREKYLKSKPNEEENTCQ